MVVGVHRLLCAMLIGVGLLGLTIGSVAAQPRAVVVEADATGIVNPALADYLARVIDQAEQQCASAVVIRLDTPGGLDGAMRQIISRILASRVPVVVYVAPPGARAGSAGVYLTYASHVAAMAPNTNIGSATPVVMGQGGETTLSPEMRAKITNDAVAYIRGLAERHGRNADWAEQAVREGANVTASDALSQHVVDVVAPDLPRLLQQIDGRTVELAGGQTVLRTADATVVTVEMNPLERFLHLISDPTIAYILLSLGSLGLMLELYNPGGILPGVVGGLFLLLALYALGTLPVNYAALLLIGFGFLLFVADVLSPTHGILTTGGVIAFVLGSLMLFNTAGAEPYLQVSLWAIAAMALTLLGFFLLVIGAVARSRKRRVTTGREGMIGQVGEVRSRLDPTGYIHIDGELWRAQSLDRPVEVGERVRVTAIEGLLLTVRPEQPLPPAKPEPEPIPTPAAEPAPTDGSAPPEPVVPAPPTR